MITYNGVLVMPNNQEAPTILDMAIGLGRQPRFGGHTNRNWPVLLHSLVCERLMGYLHPSPLNQLYALIHDGHECVTCDVPSTWKTEETKRQQWDLDLRIFRRLRVPMPDQESEDWISQVDQLAVMAEGQLYGPPGIIKWFGTEPVGLALDVVQEIGGKYKTGSECDGPIAPAVREFVTKVHSLIDVWRGSLHGNSSWIRPEKR